METELKKNTKKLFSKIGFLYLAGTIIMIASQLIFYNVIALIAPKLVTNYDGSLLAYMLPMYLVGVPITIFLICRIPSDPVPEKKKMSVGKWIMTFVMCYACMYVCNVIGLIITNIIGILKNGSVQNAMADIATTANPLTTFFIAVICAPVIEEIIFRKLLVDRVSKYGEKVAILLSGFMFGLFHANLNQFVYAFALGCFFAFIYTRTRNLLYVVTLHMGINFIGSVLGSIMLEQTGTIIFTIYTLLMLAMIVTGIVLLIVNRKKFVCNVSETVIPKGQCFQVVMLNAGMIAFSVVWIAVIIIQLLL